MVLTQLMCKFSENTYMHEICLNLPRILALFDKDTSSNSHGIGDRYYWAWGLIDFGNGSFQGAAHGMARLWRAGLWPYSTPFDHFFYRINSIFEGTKMLTQKNGSLEEAFPNEGSYCVTALVAFDLLCVIDLLGGELNENQLKNWKGIVAPLVTYLKKADETHALISNHIATAAAALLRWHQLIGDQKAEQKARLLLNRILNHQSEEGWFKEYEGADPGYQTLCTYYLADIHQLRPDLGLHEPLRRSVQFLWYFAHPDGSFGGLYGSRCTRFYYPAGIEALSQDFPEAAALASFMCNSIAKHTVVTLSSMDEPNLIPMFNAYAWAATLKNKAQKQAYPRTLPLIPCQNKNKMRIHFKHAGIFIDRGSLHYSIVCSHKGGVVYHFQKGHATIIDAGLLIKDQKGRFGSSQSFNPSNVFVKRGDKLKIISSITENPKRLPVPFQFVFLRLLSMTAFRFMWLREFVKRRLVKLLITRRVNWPIQNIRYITLGTALKVEDKTILPNGYEKIPTTEAFVAIHMASQGYWQLQDENFE